MRDRVWRGPVLRECRGGDLGERAQRIREEQRIEAVVGRGGEVEQLSAL